MGLFLAILYSKLVFSQDAPPSSENTETNPYLNKGTEYFKNGQYPEAIEQFQKDIQSNPKDALAYSLLSSTYFLLGRDKEGEENIQKAIELYNNVGDSGKAEKLMSLLKNYKMSKAQTIGQEAKINLKIIQLTEKMFRLDKKSYISCDSTEDCNSKLNLNLSGDRWKYYVFTDDKGGFCSEARGSGGTSSWFIKEEGNPIKGTCDKINRIIN